MAHVSAQAVERPLRSRHIPYLDLFIHGRREQQVADFGEQADGVDALGVPREGSRTLLGDVAPVVCRNED